ncbi:MAG: plastocyanin/azurin family copper-binding protein [Actinomycetota bacterium]
MTPAQTFSPEETEVSAGTTIEFVNDSPEAHTVTVDQPSLPEGASYFASGGFTTESAARADMAGGLLTEGETYSVTLEVPGTYRYVCLPHESQGMLGTIVVEP